jgi:hypothetical protein
MAIRNITKFINFNEIGDNGDVFRSLITNLVCLSKKKKKIADPKW